MKKLWPLLLLLPVPMMYGLTVHQAINKALKTSSEMAYINGKINQDQVQIAIEKQKLYPELSIKGVVEKTNAKKDSQVSLQANWKTLIGTTFQGTLEKDVSYINIQQPLLNNNLPVIRLLPLNKAKDQLKSTYLEKASLQQNIISQTLQLYFDVYQQKNHLKTVKKSFKTAQHHWSNAQKKFNRGDLSEIELYDVKAFYLKQKLDLSQAENHLQQTKNKLASQINDKVIDVEGFIHLNKTHHFKLPTQKDFDKHPKILQMKRDLYYLQLDKKIIHYNQQNELNFSAKIDSNSNTEWGLDLLVPIKTNLDKKQKLAKLSSEIIRLKRQINDKKTDLYFDTLNAYQSFLSLNKQLEIAQLEKKSLQLKNKASQIKFKNGNLSYSNLTDSFQKIYKKNSDNQLLEIDRLKKMVNYYALTYQLNHVWEQLLEKHKSS